LQVLGVASAEISDLDDALRRLEAEDLRKAQISHDPAAMPVTLPSGMTQSHPAVA